MKANEADGIRFVRRRYGRTTYTWLHVRIAGDVWAEAGCDPWPCLNPPRQEVLAEVAKVRTRYQPDPQAIDPEA